MTNPSLVGVLCVKNVVLYHNSSNSDLRTRGDGGRLAEQNYLSGAFTLPRVPVLCNGTAR